MGFVVESGGGGGGGGGGGTGWKKEEEDARTHGGGAGLAFCSGGFSERIPVYGYDGRWTSKRGNRWKVGEGHTGIHRQE